MQAVFAAGEAAEQVITASNLVHVIDDGLTVAGTIRARDKIAIRNQVQRSDLERLNGETVCFLCKQHKEEDVSVECDTYSCPRRFHPSCIGQGTPKCHRECCETCVAPVDDPTDILAMLG